MASDNTANNMKKKVIIIFLIVAIIMVLMYASFSVLSLNLEDFLYEVREPGNAIFPYPANFEENIFEDEEYMDLDRLICYTDENTGVTVSIDETDYSTYNETVTFMYEFIMSIINGDTAFYNDCFNDLYIAAEGKQSAFTMQKLYDIEFSILETGVDSLTGKTYTKLWLDYKIFKNNVTLRTDIGSDVCRRQFLTLVKEDNGLYKIQAVNTMTVQPIKVLNIKNAVILVVAVILAIVSIVVAIVFAVRSSRAKKNFGNDADKDNDSAKLQPHEIVDVSEKQSE